MNTSSSEYHVPVLLNDCVDALQVEEGGIFVDVTFGGGGHSKVIFDKLPEGKLIVFDQDPDARPYAADFESDAKRSFVFVPANFRYLKQYLKFHKATQVDGILADLGVSSHQFDTGARGFSTRFEGLLDMRMDQASELDARKVVGTYDEKDLMHMFSYYGDIRNARTLAKAIVQARQIEEIQTTDQLLKIAQAIAPRGKHAKYFAQIFQAIRIVVNDEVGALEDMLTDCVEMLKPGGRLVVMSYHSLEDRLVKSLINTGNLKGMVEKDFYGNLIRPLEPVNRKPIIPSEEEIAVNSRARSAKLRVAIKQ
ncbi:MAG: 16S rRNA (cytosine1402-N4)-methyltransferase [Cyclobacteriaceae bacterium]|jgi:16S rRNA (cytosine1402-N4)-methyltransferase